MILWLPFLFCVCVKKKRRVILKLCENSRWWLIRDCRVWVFLLRKTPSICGISSHFYPYILIKCPSRMAFFFIILLCDAHSKCINSLIQIKSFRRHQLFPQHQQKHDTTHYINKPLKKKFTKLALWMTLTRSPNLALHAFSF